MWCGSNTACIILWCVYIRYYIYTDSFICTYSFIPLHKTALYVLILSSLYIRRLFHYVVWEQHVSYRVSVSLVHAEGRIREKINGIYIRLCLIRVIWVPHNIIWVPNKVRVWKMRLQDKNESENELNTNGCKYRLSSHLYGLQHEHLSLCGVGATRHA